LRKGMVVNVNGEDRLRLAAILANRNGPQKHVWRVQIILLTADGLGTAEIMRRTGKSKSVVWRWQERFMHAGVDGLLRDKTRPSRRPPLDRALIARVVELTASDPCGEATHWTGGDDGQDNRDQRQLGSAYLAAPTACSRLSKDPAFGAKLKDIAGLYVDPPAHAVVLSVDEKSQIQALDRTQPGLPMKRGRAGTMTHDYKRHQPQ